MNTQTKQYDIKPELNIDELAHILSQYHFEEKDFDLLLSVYSMVCYSLNTKIFIDFSKCYNSITLENYCVAIVTLGEKIDLLIDRLCEDGKLLEAYMADCISLALLSKLYRELVPIVMKETNQTITRLSFLGDEFPIELAPEILEKMDHCTVSINSGYMFSPLKTVCIILPIDNHGEDVDKICSICSNCGNLSCAFKKTESITNPQTLTYGYQRIFGKI